jgi:hypothetical protein
MTKFATEIFVLTFGFMGDGDLPARLQEPSSSSFLFHWDMDSSCLCNGSLKILKACLYSSTLNATSAINWKKINAQEKILFTALSYSNQIWNLVK